MNTENIEKIETKICSFRKPGCQETLLSYIDIIVMSNLLFCIYIYPGVTSL